MSSFLRVLCIYRLQWTGLMKMCPYWRGVVIVSVFVPQAVEVLGEEEDGWWRGQLGDKIGLFPSNFVEVITEESTPAPESSSVAPPPHDTDGAPHLPPDRPRMAATLISVGSGVSIACLHCHHHPHLVTTSLPHHRYTTSSSHYHLLTLITVTKSPSHGHTVISLHSPS